MRISIHQPNLFPHIPFFDKMKESDVFVLLNHCQFEKNNYQNRFRYNDKWFTMSVIKGNIPINQKQYVNAWDDWQTITGQLPNLKQFDRCIYNTLAVTNGHIIMHIMRCLNIKTKLVNDYPTNLTGTARLVDICKTNEAKEYLSGPSGKNYLDLEQFEKAGIKVVFQEPSESKPIIDLL